MADTYTRQAGTIVVGFGFSCIPLLRELDRTGEDYLIISDPAPSSVWSILKAAGRLDFDLVSSYYTSFYSFDLVKDFRRDMYPLASEFYAMHLAHYEKYKDRIVGKHVAKIENFDGYSVVHADDGCTYRATHLVVSTAFRRNIHNDLCTFDYSIQGKTVVFQTVGDSSNLMIAKLLAGNNRIVCLTNGFLAFDKMFERGGKTATLDQFEFHNFSALKKIYRAFMGGVPFLFDQFFTNTGGIWGWKLRLAKLMTGPMFWFKYPHLIHRDEADPQRYRKGAAVPNGLIAIKYWPIDTYAQMFGKDLEESIRRGYLLNDLPMWIDEGLVEVYSKKDSAVDREKKVVTCGGKEIPYDYLVDGGPERPRLPRIVQMHGGEAKEYEYNVRRNYLGVIPESLSNVYFLGIIRPFTGGLANMTEIQSLFVHKMIANDSFCSEIRSTLSGRIRDYEERYYLSLQDKPTDHVVFYGTYTEEVARATGIDLRFRDCRSLGDVRRWLMFPNNAFKYRQTGEYTVEGCSELVRYIEKEHGYWAAILLALVSIGIYHAIALICIGRMYLSGTAGLAGTAALLAFYYFFIVPGASVMGFLSSSPIFLSLNNYLRFGLMLCGLAATIWGPPAIGFAVLAFEVLLTVAVRTKSKDIVRYVFNDLGNKKEYRQFLTRYLETYRRVTAKKAFTHAG
jgi:hypothetical protein